MRGVKDMKGYAIGAIDGDIGKVVDFLFDDESWTIRYLVADTGNWLPDRQVLISPIALDVVDCEGERIPVSLTKDQVKNSPDIEGTSHFSRQQEIPYYDYYGWPYYWVGGGIWGPGIYPGDLTVAGRNQEALSAQDIDEPHMRSAKEVTGYYIEATDGDIGHVEDFIIDDETWQIRHMVVDTRNWWPGKKVLVAPRWIDRVSWSDSRVYVDLSQKTIKSGPEYDQDALSRE